jgi:hypothetical protein
MGVTPGLAVICSQAQPREDAVSVGRVSATREGREYPMKKLYAAAAAAALAAMPTGAHAATVELALLIDGSGSISSSNFLLQRNAYANVLNDATILPQDGTIAIGVWQFGTTVQQVFAMTEINAGNIGALIAAINGMTQLNTSTNIAGAIDTATAAIFGNSIASTRQLIDVSTDGVNNVGNLATSRANALAAGIDQINCIGIGVGANCTPVQGGTGSFSLQADSFDDFQAALRQKIGRETGAIPEPGTWALLILGFGAVGATQVAFA